MYERFFNLTAEPFRLSPDHRFCYNHARYAKAKAYMAYAFMRAEGFVMVTGRPGTGKTTLIGDLVESLADENVAVANLVSTQLAADDLLRMVAFAFGLQANQMPKSTILRELDQQFLNLQRSGGRALLIVDEAQDLNHQAMEELRLLTNLQQDGKPLLQIFLLGQPELRDLVHSQGLEQVHQRIIAASHLDALPENEIRAYVEHRLAVVGWRNHPAISAAVFPIIYLFSEGVPRRINLICSRLLLHCCVEQRQQIAVADARIVVEELQDEQLSSRNLLNNDLFFAEDIFDEPLPVDVFRAPTDVRANRARGQRGPQAESLEFAEDTDPGPNQNTETYHDEVSSGNLFDGSMPGCREPDDCSAVPEIDFSSSATAMDQSSEQGELNEISLHKRPPGVLNTDVWLTLLAALVAGGVVALVAGMDRFM